MSKQPDKKTLLLVFRSFTDIAQVNTGLDAAIAAGIFEQNISILLLGDAPNALGRANMPQHQLVNKLDQIADYGVRHVYFDSLNLTSLPISVLAKPTIFIPVSREKIKQLLCAADQIISF